MLKKIMLATALSGLLSVPAMTCTIDGKEGLLPENNEWIGSDSKSMQNSNIDEVKFNEVIDSVLAVYDPVVTSLGATLKVQRNWDDGTVNAYASRRKGTWNVAMFGGLARHEAITPDGFALVVCHELGHHIGGAPKKASWYSAWASNEGQSDYFATLKCLRKVFRSDNNIALMGKVEVPDVVKTTCTKQFNNTEEQAICQRGAMAGMSTAKLFQSLRKQPASPKFDTPDTKTVSRTNDNHPATQCRLDTYYAGAICSQLDSDDVDQTDEVAGVCYRNNGEETGVRPLCWFSPKLTSSL